MFTGSSCVFEVTSDRRLDRFDLDFENAELNSENVVKERHSLDLSIMSCETKIAEIEKTASRSHEASQVICFVSALDVNDEEQFFFFLNNISSEENAIERSFEWCCRDDGKNGHCGIAGN